MLNQSELVIKLPLRFLSLKKIKIKLTLTNSFGELSFSKKVYYHQAAAQQLFFSDSYGFIESEDHTRETFFHYSELSVSPDQIEHGTTVQYTEKIKDNKVCGINVRPLGTESYIVLYFKIPRDCSHTRFL